LGRLRNISKFLTPHAFSILFKTFVIPVYDYGLDIWGPQSASQIPAIQNSINRLLFATHRPSLNRKLRRGFLKGNKLKRKKLFNQFKSSLDVSLLLQQLGILTVSERLEWILLKMYVNPLPILKRILQNSTTSPSIQDVRVNFRSLLFLHAKPSSLATV